MKRKYNWINDEVKIDFKLPSFLQKKVDMLERLDYEMNDCYFDECEYLECDAKECYVTGVLTKEQWDKLCERYNPSV